MSFTYGIITGIVGMVLFSLLMDSIFGTNQQGWMEVLRCGNSACDKPIQYDHMTHPRLMRASNATGNGPWVIRLCPHCGTTFDPQTQPLTTKPAIGRFRWLRWEWK